jgi:hypothetical protein
MFVTIISCLQCFSAFRKSQCPQSSKKYSTIWPRVIDPSGLSYARILHSNFNAFQIICLFSHLILSNYVYTQINVHSRSRLSTDLDSGQWLVTCAQEFQAFTNHTLNAKSKHHINYNLLTFNHSSTAFLTNRHIVHTFTNN